MYEFSQEEADLHIRACRAGADLPNGLQCACCGQTEKEQPSCFYPDDKLTDFGTEALTLFFYLKVMTILSIIMLAGVLVAINFSKCTDNLSSRFSCTLESLFRPSDLVLLLVTVASALCAQVVITLLIEVRYYKNRVDLLGYSDYSLLLKYITNNELRIIAPHCRQLTVVWPVRKYFLHRDKNVSLDAAHKQLLVPLLRQKPLQAIVTFQHQDAMLQFQRQFKKGIFSYFCLKVAAFFNGNIVAFVKRAPEPMELLEQNLEVGLCKRVYRRVTTAGICLLVVVLGGLLQYLWQGSYYFQYLTPIFSVILNAVVQLILAQSSQWQIYDSEFSGKASAAFKLTVYFIINSAAIPILLKLYPQRDLRKLSDLAIPQSLSFFAFPLLQLLPVNSVLACLKRICKKGNIPQQQYNKLCEPQFFSYQNYYANSTSAFLTMLFLGQLKNIVFAFIPLHFLITYLVGKFKIARCKSHFSQGNKLFRSVQPINKLLVASPLIGCYFFYYYYPIQFSLALIIYGSCTVALFLCPLGRIAKWLAGKADEQTPPLSEALAKFKDKTGYSSALRINRELSSTLQLVF